MDGVTFTVTASRAITISGQKLLSPFAQSLLVSLGTLLVLMVLLWIASVIRRDASIVDPFWGCGFVVVTWLCWWFHSPSEARPAVLAILTTVWGLRLSIFLTWRNWNHDEDRRYQAMRHYHGARFTWVSLFTVFLLQGIILWFVSFPIQAVITAYNPRPMSWLDGLAIVVWVMGFCFESLGDWQLARFKADPENRGKVMNRGLWKYTRHPNYFGDFCVWWGVYLLALSAGGWWTLGSPLLMSILLMKVSGVTLLESTITERRPDYAVYRKQTNAFFPGWPSIQASLRQQDGSDTSL